MPPAPKEVAPVDLMLIGEFCEKDGPVVRHLYALGDSGRVECFPPELWPRGAEDLLHQFMMRAMSGDHVFPERADAALQYRACEVLMDRVKWIDDTLLVAYVSSVTLFDVYARGYARTACVAYLSSDEHKMFTISHWLSMECQSITRRLFESTFATHKAELVQCVDALEVLSRRLAKDEVIEGLTDRNRNGIKSELEALRSRVIRSAPPRAVRARRGTALNRTLDEAPVPDSFEFAMADLRTNSSLVLSPHTSPLLDEKLAEDRVPLDVALDIVHRLVTTKGCGVLRSLSDICATNGFDDAQAMIQRTMWAFALDTVWLMENMIQVMRPLPDLLEQPLGDILAAQWPTHAATERADDLNVDSPIPSNPFILKIGDCVVVDPYLRRSPPAPQASEHELFTYLLEGNLYSVLREYGTQPALALMFNALACRPVVVCGEDEGEVLQAMRLASTFVPGIFQSRDKQTLMVGVLPFSSAQKVRVTYEHLERYAVTGCPVHAILDEKTQKPFLPSAFVWHVQSSTLPSGRGKNTQRSRTVAFYGPTYNVAKPPPSSERTAERMSYADPTDPSLSLPSQATGLLTEVHDLLALRPSTRGEEHSLTNYLRLTLKRIFLDYGTMAANVLNSLLIDAQRHHQVILSGYFNSSVNGSPVAAPAPKAKTSPATVAASSLNSPPQQSQPWPTGVSNTSITSSMATIPSPATLISNGHPVYIQHKWPFVLTEQDVKSMLKYQHGYAALHADDILIVTNLVQRMAILCAEYEPGRKVR